MLFDAGGDLHAVTTRAHRLDSVAGRPQAILMVRFLQAGQGPVPRGQGCCGALPQ